MRRLAVALLFLSTTARGADPVVPLAVDGAVLVENNVRVGGATTKGARVALFRGASCRGEPVATTRAEEGGRFTVSADGFDVPFTISLRAATDKGRSECFDLTVR